MLKYFYKLLRILYWFQLDKCTRKVRRGDIQFKETTIAYASTCIQYNSSTLMVEARAYYTQPDDSHYAPHSGLSHLYIVIGGIEKRITYGVGSTELLISNLIQLEMLLRRTYWWLLDSNSNGYLSRSIKYGNGYDTWFNVSINKEDTWYVMCGSGYYQLIPSEYRKNSEVYMAIAEVLIKIIPQYILWLRKPFR